MELKKQKFGIEIEMTGITRAKAAEVTAGYFGTRVKYLGTYYDTYAASVSNLLEDPELEMIKTTSSRPRLKA